jgi:hypothetical protein
MSNFVSPIIVGLIALAFASYVAVPLLIQGEKAISLIEDKITIIPH